MAAVMAPAAAGRRPGPAAISFFFLLSFSSLFIFHFLLPALRFCVSYPGHLRPTQRPHYPATWNDLIELCSSTAAALFDLQLMQPSSYTEFYQDTIEECFFFSSGKGEHGSFLS